MPTVAIGSDQVATLPACGSGCLASVTGDLRWARAAESRWGACGLADQGTDGLVGYALMAPGWHATQLPGWRVTTSTAAHKPSAILVAVWVAAGAHSANTHRRLLEGLIARLAMTRDYSLDARGSRWRPTCTRPNVATLSRVGFVIVAGPALTPLMRVNVDAAVPSKAPVQPWHGLLPRPHRPAPPPAPAQRTDQVPGGGTRDQPITGTLPVPEPRWPWSCRPGRP